MDDEPVVRMIAARMLDRLGFFCDPAEEGGQAVAAYRTALERQEPYAAVFLDLTVPMGMNGRETIRELLKLDADAVVIVTSGNPSDPVMENYKAHGFRHALAKPFKLENLQFVLSAVSLL